MKIVKKNYFDNDPDMLPSVFIGDVDPALFAHPVAIGDGFDELRKTRPIIIPKKKKKKIKAQVRERIKRWPK